MEQPNGAALAAAAHGVRASIDFNGPLNALSTSPSNLGAINGSSSLDGSDAVVAAGGKRQRSAVTTLQHRPVRSAAEVKRDVLALVRATQPRAPPQSDLAGHYESYKSACSAWLIGVFADANSDTAQQKQQQQQHNNTPQAVGTHLQALMQCATVSRHAELVTLVLRSLDATTQITHLRRKKRRLPSITTTALLPTRIATAVHTSDQRTADAAAATSALSQRRVVDLVSIWLLHRVGLLRFEDPLHALAAARVATLPATASTGGSAFTWLTASLQTLLVAPARRLELSSLSPSSDRLASIPTMMATTQTLADCVLGYVVRLAFAQPPAATSNTHNVAWQALHELCAFTSTNFSLVAFERVTQLLAARTTAASDSPTSTPIGLFRVPQDTLVRFFQPTLAQLVASDVQTLTSTDHTALFHAYATLLPAAALVHVVRHCVLDAAAASRGVDGALYTFVKRLRLRIDTSCLILTLAHDLARDGVQQTNGALLQLAFELVATVSEENDVDSTAVDNSMCYGQWIHEHVGAHTHATDARVVPTSPTTTTNAVALCSKPRATCRSIIQSKRHVQFLCAFLLEFDRRVVVQSPTVPVTRAAHVAAHLRMLKTHQSLRSTGDNGLLMDACSQTRSRYLELLQQEQAAAKRAVTGARTLATEAADAVAPTRQTHLAAVRATVRESIALFTTTNKLSLQLRQYKLFQPKRWKHELVPCALDVAAFDMEDDTKDASLLAHVAFVHALATQALIPVNEYATFVTHVETLLFDTDTARQRQQQQQRTRTQHTQPVGMTPRDAMDAALERLQRDVHAQRNSVKLSQATIATLRNALRGALESLQQDDAIVGVVDTVWTTGVVRALEIVGVCKLDDAFFAAVVPVLTDRSIAMRVVDALAARGVDRIQQSRIRSDSSDDSAFVIDVSCVAAFAASLLDRLSANSDAMRDAMRVVQRIDAACLCPERRTAASAESDDSATSNDAVTVAVAGTRGTTIHRRAALLRRSVFVVCLLRAIHALPRPTHAATALLECHTLDVDVRDTIAWLAMRAVACCSSSCNDQQENDDAAGGTGAFLLSFLLESLRVLAHCTWIRDVFVAPLTTALPRPSPQLLLERLVRYELRYGLQLFGSTATLQHKSAHASLQQSLDVLGACGAFRSASTVVDVVEWIIVEILQHVANSNALRSDESDENDASCFKRDAIDRVVAHQLLVLSDGMHRLFAAPTPLDGVDRVVAFYAQAAQAVGGSITSSSFSRLQHDGLEIFELCAQHHESHAAVASGDCRVLQSATYRSHLVALLRVICERRVRSLRPTLLRAVLFYTMRVLRSAGVDDGSDATALATASRIQQLPLAVVVRCSIDWPQHRSTAIAMMDTSNSSNNSNADSQLIESFVMHVDKMHAFVACVTGAAADRNDAIASTTAAGDRIREETTTSTMYQLEAVKLLFRWHVLAVPTALQQQLEAPQQHSAYMTIAERLLCALDASTSAGSSSSSSNRNLQTANSVALASDLVRAYNDATAVATLQSHRSNDDVDAHYQLVLVHAVAALCVRSARVVQHLLHSWQDGRASSTTTDSSALFVVLVAIALSASGADAAQLTHVLAFHTSLWLNTFPRIALHVHALRSASSADGVAVVAKVLGHSQRFVDQLVRVLRFVLQHSVAHHVDVLDAALPGRISATWPQLQSLASQLHVLPSLNATSGF